MTLRLCCLFMLLIVGACSQEQHEKTDTLAGASVSAQAEEKEKTLDLVAVQTDYQGLALKVLDISERSLEGRNALAVMLSVPLDPADDQHSYLNVSQKKGGVVDGSWILSDSGKTLWFPHLEPNTQYDITVYPGLKAANAQVLATTVSASIHTRHLNPVVNFDTNGSFLRAGLGNGLPVVAVNVEQVNIDFFRIKADRIDSFLEQMGNYRHYYWDMQRLTKNGELVYSGRYELASPKNTRVKRSIDVSDTQTLREPGLYLAVMLAAGDYQKQQVLWFCVTDLGLHARQYHQQLDVHVSSLKTGKPLAEVKVSLLGAQSTLLHQSRTSPEGLASFKVNDNKTRLIVAQAGQHYSVIETRKPALDLSDFDIGRRPQLPLELFVYTPRDLFRPGEVIDFNALLRDGDGRTPQATVLNAQINRPDGSVAKTFKWQSQDLAYYHYAWQVPGKAAVGNWELVLTGALKKPKVYPFKVEEFLPERMKLSINPKSSGPMVVAPNETLKVPVLGEYLYGAPASGNRLSTLVRVKPWRSPIKTLEHYQFGDVNEVGLTQGFELKDLRLDKQGEGELLIPSHWRDVRSPLEIKTISSLYETGGRPVTRVYSSLVWPAKALLGIRSSFGDNNPEANSRVSFDIVKASVKAQLYAAKNVQVELVREDRHYFWVYDDGQGWHYKWTDKEFVEHSQVVSIEAGKSVRVEYPVSYGHYRLQVRDPENNLRSSYRFYAGNNWYTRWQESQSGKQAARPDKVSIVLDKKHYKAGDIAKVTIVPPQEGEALVMVEADSPLWMQRVLIPETGVTLEIPVDKQWQQHNLYISVMVLRRSDDKTSIGPTRSFGLAHLALDRSDRELRVTMDVPEKILPDQTLHVPLRVSGGNNQTGRSQKVYVTLAAVDVGVLSISHFSTPNPHEGFFGRRHYSVESRDIYDQVIDVSETQKARLRFGGDADVSHGGNEPQSDVQIVSLFSGVLEVNEGRALVPLHIPNFNGRLRLMALAFSADSVGHAEQELKVAAPIVTQLAMPRFLALGDKAIVALDINNLSGQSQTVHVDLQSQGPITLTGKAQQLTLADKEKITLNFEIEANAYTGQAQFDLQLRGESTPTVKRRWHLGVRPAYPALIQQHSALLENGERFSLGQEHVKGMLVPGTLFE
ncbi:MAG: alpha-2-macroglobulin family protein, partial [Spongiibacteraceae bacterium]|nr:alpha-2-macroglobulin family protein [Spongiibacteraceae bacterium]